MKYIGRGLIALGLIIMIIPTIGTLWIQYEEQSLYIAYLQEQQLQRQEQQAVEVEQKEGAEGVGEIDTFEERLVEKEEEGLLLIHKEEGEVIGKIKIPAIKLDLLLLEGITEKSLSKGAGHMTGTAWPGQKGNCTIAGHRNYTFGSRFNRLGQVKEGDVIILEVGDKAYTYKVTEIKVVIPEDLSPLEQPLTERKVTLITCHPIYKATHRLIVIGEKTESEETGHTVR
ncbi:hypothetical protein CS063_10270 [Sporanaerobium hydrogeniformans]|uniref:Uncharacterized protein n=1 Tax=Sporanaerobium hydrogeniformans TaxID=3072179 RepID=A0AC61DCI9_9FIRM|nr:class D sortase [Sporanaerobium hydrogeniformans]PHV70465.1 hypothetical protein CS063_10270 [Sporanaerobium hydrogeniformans]